MANNLPINPNFQPSLSQVKECQDICCYIIDTLINNPYQVCKYTTHYGFEISACLNHGILEYFFSPYWSEHRQVIAAIFDDFNVMMKEKIDKIDKVEKIDKVAINNYKHNKQKKQKKQKNNKHRKH